MKKGKKRRNFEFIFIIIAIVIVIGVLFYYFNQKVLLQPAFEEPAGGLYYFDGGDYFILGNSKVEFIFNRTNNGNISISQLKNVGTGRIFSTKDNGLIKIGLRNETFKKEYALSDLNYQPSYSIAVGVPDADKLSLILNWKDVTFLGLEQSQKMNISATVVLAEEENTAEFWIDINTSMDKYSLYNVTFPVVEVAGFTNPSREALVMPWLMGKLVINPRVDLLNVLPGAMAQGWFTFSGHTNYATYTYQFSAYYDMDTLDMFYFGTKDPYEYYKEIFWTLSTQGIKFAITQFPENHLTYDIDYHSPYPVVIGMLKGDWYDAAKYYRPWSIQNFAKRGKLENATGISSAFHDLDFKLTLSMPYSLDSYRQNYTNGINESRDYKNYFNECPDAHMPNYQCDPTFRIENATIEVYQWQNGTTFSLQEGWPSDYKPIHPSVMELVKQSHNNGDIIIPYTIQIHFDTNSSSYNSEIESYAIVNESGQVVKFENINSLGRFGVIMDPNTTFWQNYVANIMVDHLDFGDDNASYSGIGFDGAYWDVWSGANYILLDYSGRGDHLPGGGNWWSMGEKNLIKLSRERASSLNPKLILESEHASELYVDDLEFVQWNFPEGTPPPVYNIPIYPTIFHDYIAISSIIETWPKISLFYTNQEFNRFYQAIYMTYGLFPGVSNGIINDLLTFPALEGDYETLSFSKQRVRSYAFAKKYLLYGERLRTLRFTTENYLGFPTPNIFFNDYYPGAPKVMPSVWRANDGTLGLLLVNWWNETKPINFDINFSDYELIEGQDYYLNRMGETGHQALGIYSNDFNYEINVPARSLYVLSLSSEQLCTFMTNRTCGPSNIGICRSGQQTCSRSGDYGSCVGAVYPTNEICGNSLDDDCDGSVDEGCSGSPPGGSGGGGGGGSGGGGPPIVLTQCSDRIDNDNDGLIDYPDDSGCLDRNDNSEIDSSTLNNTNVYSNNTGPSAGRGGFEEEGFKVRIFFILFTGVLAIGIIIVIVLIVRFYRHHARFKEMMGHVQAHGTRHEQDF